MLQKKLKMGKKLRDLRENSSLSQNKISELSGATQSSIAKYENDLALPTPRIMLWYAEYFDISLDYLFGRCENPQGKLYNYEPQAFKERIQNQKELEEFVEMCFDPNSPMSAKLKETMIKMMTGEVQE